MIPDLHAEAQRTGVDAVVVGRGEWSDSAFRRQASRQFFRLLHALAGVRLENVGNFGIYSRRMVDMLCRFHEQEVFLPIMVGLTGLRTSQMQVDRGSRLEGRSSYSLVRLLRLAAAIIIRFSDRPLKLSALVGLTFAAVAFVLSLFLFVGYFLGAFTVPGWTSVVLSVWFLSGLIMLVLGIHGFYLGRVFAEVRARPRLSVERTTFGPAADRP
jgi:dolichol-phosphate mannosyltransferase